MWCDLRLEMQGNSLRGYFDGRQYLHITDSTFASGKIGLRTYGGQVDFDGVGAGH